jgi:tripartite-type tricarboxylate transporter receptor subunit TctC
MHSIYKMIAALAVIATLPCAAMAQEWPARPITMVIPTAAGGGADILGRILAARLTELLGQPVIIENVGNAVAATNRIAKGVPDGYHFNMGGTAHIWPSIRPSTKPRSTIRAPILFRLGS